MLAVSDITVCLGCFACSFMAANACVRRRGVESIYDRGCDGREGKANLGGAMGGRERFAQAGNINISSVSRGDG